jgi:hypothetical protein
MAAVTDSESSRPQYLRRLIRLAFWSLAALLSMAAAAPENSRRLDLSLLSEQLSENGLPTLWQPLNFSVISARTSYEVVTDMRYGPVIHASSSGGAGGIGRPLSENPRQFPLLTWYWKIGQTLPGSSLYQENGDDFPVRLMLSFSSKESGEKDRILCYVWASDDPVNAYAVNPSHDHVMTIVAASGSEQSGSWLELSRNIVDDYIRVFSEEPGVITGVALMTDGDDTGSSVQAWYGPVLLGADPGSK